jgi:septum formation protein
MKPIVLASRSPRRKHLLEQAGIAFEVISADTDESYPAGITLEEIPIHIARHKAHFVKHTSLFARYAQGSTILAADTIVEVDGKIIGKPDNRQHAIELLTLLSGRMHRVITGVVILQEEKEITLSETTEVYFFPLTEEQILYYVDHFHPFDKAGAYAIQEWIGLIGVEKICGDFYNVMGLPVSRVIKALEECL